MVKMSRMMPPTPVAAPWYGSMADGWLWLSMRMATAIPSPTSTTPAFSPKLARTHGASNGSRPRWTRDDLYEQCSDHMTAYMASSKSLAGRPRSSVMAAASSSVRPSSRWRARVMDGKLPDIPAARLGLDIAIALRQNKENASQDQTFKVADVRLSQGGARRG